MCFSVFTALVCVILVFTNYPLANNPKKMSAKPILYQIPLSPPVRAVLLVADAIGLELELRYVDLMKKEQLNPEYIKVSKLKLYFQILIECNTANMHYR